MKNLFGSDGVFALDAFCMTNTLFAFDYDGTLAPIVNDPRSAVMRPDTSLLIRKIQDLAPVALISGRARADVANFLTMPIDYIIGNHGLEGLPGGVSSLEQAGISCKKWHDALRSELKADGVVIEDKNYSLAIHYRLADDKRKVKSFILNLVTSLTPAPRIVMGKCVINLMSPGAPHKGIALLELMLRSGCRSAVYFGDDDNDEDVFRLGEESILTVRVGKNESSTAMFYLNSQTDIDKALECCYLGLKKAGKTPRETTETGIARESHTV